MKNLRNYTSTVSPDKSILTIERDLVRAGATHMAKKYSPTGEIEAVLFQMNYEGNFVTFQVPANVPATERYMMKKFKKTASATLHQQALRTAWKNVSEWIQIQVDMILLQQLEPLEAFLPYVYSNRTGLTYYQSLKESNFKALPQ